MYSTRFPYILVSIAYSSVPTNKYEMRITTVATYKRKFNLHALTQSLPSIKINVDTAPYCLYRTCAILYEFERRDRKQRHRRFEASWEFERTERSPRKQTPHKRKNVLNPSTKNAGSIAQHEPLVVQPTNRNPLV